MSKFYVYTHLFSNNRLYIGKGVGERCNDFRNRSEFWKRNFCKYGDPTVTIIAEGLEESVAFELEEFLIAEHLDSGYILGDTLINFTKGGEGASGYTHTEETKKAIGEASKALMQDDTYKAKWLEKSKAYHKTDKAKETKSKNSKQNWENPEYRKIRTKQIKDMWQDENHKTKMSDRMKGANNPSAKRANIYKYPSHELIAENVVSAEWARENGYSRPKLQTTAKSDLSKPSSANNPHHHKKVYMRYINE